MIKKWLGFKENNKNKAKSSTNQEQNQEALIEKCPIYYIPCDDIRPNALRSRSDFDEDKLVALAYSIKKYGIIEPLCVRETDIDDSYSYELIAGERRLRAAKLAGIASVPCVIFSSDSLISAELSFIENTFRENLNYFESAFALKRILEQGDSSIEDASARLNISKQDIQRKLRLLELSFEERQLLLNYDICEEIALEIAKIPEKAARISAIKEISERDMGRSAALFYLKNYSTPLLSRSDGGSKSPLPRDINSVITGLSRRIRFLNRGGERAKMSVERSVGGLEVKIDIIFDVSRET